MKYIFDFDDVLFNNTAQFKRHMFKVLAEAGVPETEARKYYYRPEVHGKEFSLKKFMKDLFSRPGRKVDESQLEELYEKIMKEAHNFLNTDLVEAVKRIGKENCYLVSNGYQEFNQDKIRYSGIWDLFKKISVVPKKKNEAIDEIYSEPGNKKEVIVFIDDKQKFIDDLDKVFLRDHPNLVTIRYESQLFEDLMREIKTRRQDDASSEIRRK